LTNGDSVILVGAHYDHVGIGAPVNGDSIYNGADDDASGVVAMLEMARIMKQWPTPGRTIVFSAFTGEESGFIGTRYYIDHPVRPIASTAADLQIEMIGRPDTITMGPGRAWLTGYERTTMGEMFQQHGLPIVPDPRPSMSFFSRSDNYDFALVGIPAHTLSSFNMHTDYHTPSDDVSKVDFDHMARMINVGAKAMWILAEGAAPRWLRGQRPCPRVPTPSGPVALSSTQADSAARVNQFPRNCPGM
jgi:Zn-dependent M28 family amino/carboxypeptidase